jgi:hypothetical protein
MATTGTLNNKPAVISRVTSASDKNAVTFTSVTLGSLNTPDLSSLVTTDSVISKVDVTLQGIVPIAKVGGKRDFTVIKTVKDYNRTGSGSTKVLDRYGRVLLINGANIEVEKTASGQPKFGTTSTTLAADNSPGNLSYADNKGLTYYVKMTPSLSVTTQIVGDALAS